jgi:Flp pilus assembly protein TadG
MRSLLTRSRDESGQVFVFVALILTVLVGMAALVVDAGSWYQADRKLQTAVDAAALAGAQELPLNRSDAETKAHDYAQENYGGSSVVLPTPPDAGTIDVVADADTPGIFAPVLNAALDVVTVHAEAQAKVLAPLELKNVAPIAVHKDYACIVTNPGCFNQTVTMDFGADDVLDPTKSKFGLLDLDRSGSAGAGDMKNWIEDGYPGYLPIDTDYPEANGHKHGIKNELEDAIGRTLFAPVFDTASASTGYHIIGWAAFVIDEIVTWKTESHVLRGHFVTYIATDLAAGNTLPDPDDDFGVHVITLTK